MSFIIEEGGSFRGNCDINTKGLGERPKAEKVEEETKEEHSKNRRNRRNNNQQDNEEKTA
jgi:hypothetical protein